MNTLQAGVLKGNTITTQNLELAQRGSDRQLASNSRSASSRINSVARGNRSAANIKIAQSGLAAYNSYQSGKDTRAPEAGRSNESRALHRASDARVRLRPERAAHRCAAEAVRLLVSAEPGDGPHNDRRAALLLGS